MDEKLGYVINSEIHENEWQCNTRDKWRKIINLFARTTKTCVTLTLHSPYWFNQAGLFAQFELPTNLHPSSVKYISFSLYTFLWEMPGRNAN